MDWGKQKATPKGPARKYRLWQQSPVAVCALWWEYKAARGRSDSRALAPGCYAEVHYEALVAEPDTELRRLTEFLHLPYSLNMVNFHLGKTRSHPGLSAKSAWLPATRGIRDWRRSMRPDDLELFEALAGQCLEDFGYERHFDTISGSTAELATRYRELWRQERAT